MAAKIRKELIGSTIVYDSVKYTIEDNNIFIKVAKAYGFDVFEKVTPKKKAKANEANNEGK